MWAIDHQRDGFKLCGVNLHTFETQNHLTNILDYGHFRALTTSNQLRVATASGIWDLARSNWDARFLAAGYVEIAASRNGRLVAVRTNDNICVWDAAVGSMLNQQFHVEDHPSGSAGSSDSFGYNFPYHDSSAHFAFSPDGRFLSVMTDMKASTITVYRLGLDGDSPAEVCRIYGQFPFCFSPRGDWLLANRSEGGFLKADPRTGALLREYACEMPVTRKFAWDISPDGRVAVCYCADKSYWREGSGTQVVSLDTGKTLFAIGSSIDAGRASFSPDGTRLAAPGSDDLTYLWDISAAKVAAKLPVRAHFTRFSADGSRLVVISPQGELTVLDTVIRSW